MDSLGLGVSGAEGYHLFPDKYYNSAHLAQELDNQKWHTTDTITAGRVKGKVIPVTVHGGP
jgi:hypothetical protein